MQETNRKHYTQQDKEIVYQLANLFLKDIDEAFDHMYKINDQLKEELGYTVHHNDETFFNSNFTTPYEVIQAIDHSQYDYDDYVLYHKNGSVTSFEMLNEPYPYLLRSGMVRIVELILHSMDKINFNFKPSTAELIDQLSSSFTRRQTN